MYIPGKGENEIGSMVNPNTSSFILEAGGSLLVRTEEEFNLPLDIGGICFGPARLSLKGLQIVNIGHIDPGFHGKLHFTVINLGKERLELRKHDEISTLLLFRLTKNTNSFGPEDTIDINGKLISKVVKDSLPRLADTFMDFENKASKIARDESNKANKVMTFIVLILTVIVPLLMNGLTGVWAKNKGLEDKVKELEDNIKSIQQQINTEDRLDDIEDIIKNFEQTKNTEN
jgi:hypothetical protein